MKKKPVELDEDDAPRVTPELLAKAEWLTPPANIRAVARITKERRGDGLIHATVHRGGARAGAGRKPHAKPSERFTITLPHALARQVHAAAKRANMKEASYIASLVAASA